MEPFVHLTAVAAPLPRDNVDTDSIVPSRETQSVARTGYGEKLFANWRYRPGTRVVEPDFVLNRPPFDRARILVSGVNFGCGSSREAAVWSLVQFGIRCVIAESFGTIFRNNCVRNGLLPVVLDSDAVQTLLRDLTETADPTITVDLVACSVRGSDGVTHHFVIDAVEREMLLGGADEIALTLQHRAEIDAFRERDRVLRPWVYDAIEHAPRAIGE